jgi:hypothetical protein
MIRTRTWSFLAATVIALAASFFDWPQAPEQLIGRDTDTIAWDLVTDRATPAHEMWFVLATLCLTCFAVSLLADFIRKANRNQ